jgi:tetratricopeptide (TPR) repeat protein
LTNVVAAYLVLGDYNRSRNYVDEALRLHRILGQRMQEGACVGFLSHLALMQGEDAMALAHARQAVDILVEAQSPLHLKTALIALGRAELALGRWAEAAAAFERRAEVAREIGFASDVMEAFDGLATVALAQGDVALAKAHIESLLVSASTNPRVQGQMSKTFGGVLSHDNLLTIHQVLARAQDPRAEAALEEAHAALMVAADAITDATLRQGFLANIPEHREIVTLWAQR